MSRNRKRDRKRENGFTLIEVLLVLLIISMLGGIAAISIPRTLERAKVNRAQADIRGLGVAIMNYYMDERRFPAALSALAEGDDPYLMEGVPLDPWGNEYQYTYPGANRPFRYDLQTTTPDGRVIANWNLDERDPSSPRP